MPTLIDLRRRIRSVRNSQQITQAMKTVSMAKYKKAQRLVLEARPYWHIFPEIAARVASWAGEDAHPLLVKRREKKIEAVIITSDKGLAGAFNANLLVQAQAFIRERSEASTIGLVLMGKKAVNFFKRSGLRVDRSFSEEDRQARPGGGQGPGGVPDEALCPQQDRRRLRHLQRVQVHPLAAHHDRPAPARGIRKGRPGRSGRPSRLGA